MSQLLDPRYAAYEILRRVDEGGYADLLLDNYLERNPTIDPRDRALLTELVYGILRLQGKLDFALSHFCRQPLTRLEPGVRRLLRLGAYQLLELDRVPEHAAVHATVELARGLGMERVSGLVNGVLRSLQRESASLEWPKPDQPKAYLQHVCSLPVWLAKELLRQFPNRESIALAEKLSEQAPFTVRTNLPKLTREQLLAKLADSEFEARPCRFAPEGVVVTGRPASGQIPLDPGTFQVQDQASMLITHLLDPKPGEDVLDACAAPGGKTTHIAAMMENRGSLLALDKYPKRIALVEEGAQRLGFDMIEPHCCDLLEPQAFLEDRQFDRVLLDAPCSGLGVLRRNPEARWQKSAATVRELSVLQGELLQRVAPLVRPGGVLLYSVCTFTRAETEAVVDAFLAGHNDYGLEPFGDEFPDDWRELFDERGCFRCYPHRHDDMDAFFAARFRRRVEN